MSWFDILKKLTRDEMGQVRPYIKDEIEEGKKRIRSVRNRYRYKLGRNPTEEELREELSKPPKVKKPTPIRGPVGRPPKYLHPKKPRGRPIKRKPDPESKLDPNQKRFPLFHNIKLYLESQNITPTVMNILAELKEVDLTNPEQDIIDIREYLKTQNLDE